MNSHNGKYYVSPVNIELKVNMIIVSHFCVRDKCAGPLSAGPHTSPIWHHRLAACGLVLFSVGVGLALVLNLLQVQRHITLFPDEVAATSFSSTWWVALCCGTAAAVVSLLYPCINRHLGEPHEFKREWTSIMRCVAVFVGINHASAKLDFANYVQLSLTLASLSLGLWWAFDHSRSGLGLGITIAFLATLITQLLVHNAVYQNTSPDFLYILFWLPCIFFSGGVPMGNIGRQLAMALLSHPSPARLSAGAGTATAGQLGWGLKPLTPFPRTEPLHLRAPNLKPMPALSLAHGPGAPWSCGQAPAGSSK
ncbi:insulin-induced gene 2 protein-like [Erinaceus europaeus]|uniref:Insulin-induced gene protein n=1 Tax=Erinaceus europaeus TaxID=9365 RepID=A0ABM3YIM3_ERIEU|nr:insulin-induced gene 2 protein-like [Erinaceus europaeus]